MRQDLPKHQEHIWVVRLRDGDMAGLPGADINNKPVDLVIDNGAVAVKDTAGASSIVLEGVKAKGPDIKVRLNLDYLTKAFAYGLNNIGLIDPMSALLFIRSPRTAQLCR